MNDGESILETAHPILKDMLDKQVAGEVAESLGDEAATVSPEALDRLKASKKGDKLSIITEAAAREEARKRGAADSLTGLKKVDRFYNDLQIEAANFLKSKEENPAETLHVIRIDLGMLSAVNGEVGHSGGNRYKKFVAQRLIDPLSVETFDTKDPLTEYIYKNFSSFNAYIVGGDEFALIIQGEHHKVLEYMKLVEEQLATVPSEELDILPNVYGIHRGDLLDWGMVELNQLMRTDFLEMNENFTRERGSAGDIVRCTKLLDEIADTRSDMRKMYKRINLLVELRRRRQNKEDTAYDRLLQYATKATLGISDIELSAMSQSHDPKALSRSYVEKSFQRRAQGQRYEIEDPFSSRMHEYIHGHIKDYMNDI